jgi:hypothetical protein
MKDTKRRVAILNLLQVFGIRAILAGDLTLDQTVPFAIVSSEPQFVVLATNLQRELSDCRLIFLTGSTSFNRVLIQEQVPNAVFLTLPVTV